MNYFCQDFFESQGLPSFDCDQIDPLTNSSLYPPDSEAVSDEPLSCTRIENSQIPPLTYNCPPPLHFYGDTYPGQDEPQFGLPCSYECAQTLGLLYDDHQETIHSAFITFSVLSWISFVFITITLIAFLLVPTLRRWPARLVIYSGTGLWILFLGFIGNSFLSFSSLMCADVWHYQYYGWTKFSSLTTVYGSLVVAIWWVVQAFVVWWNIALQKINDDRPEKAEPYFHLVAWLYPSFQPSCAPLSPTERYRVAMQLLSRLLIIPCYRTAFITAPLLASCCCVWCWSRFSSSMPP